MRKAHFTVLVALDEHGPASQAELGRRLWIDRSDMVAVLNDLEAAGLRRARRATSATAAATWSRSRPSGIEALARLNARADAAQDALLAALSGRSAASWSDCCARVTRRSA